jgi:hypothetical protein
MVAVEDPHTVTGQQRLARPAQLGDEPQTTTCDMTDQFGGDAGLDVLELLVDALEGDRDTLQKMLVGGLNMRDRATDDQAHHSSSTVESSIFL